MKKPKILKSLPKSKTKLRKTKQIKQPATQQPQNKFADNYLQFYDDVKTPSKKHDW